MQRRTKIDRTDPDAFAAHLAFATVYLWSAYVMFIFIWLLIPGSGADSFVNNLSIVRHYDAWGVLLSLKRAVFSSICFATPLGVLGAIAAQAAMQMTQRPERVAVALGLNIGIAGLVPIVALVL